MRRVRLASHSEVALSFLSLLLVIILALLIWGCVPAFAGAAVLATERGKPARVDRRLVAVVVREGCGRALAIVLRPFSFAVRSTRGLRTEATPPPVLIIGPRSVGRASLAGLQIFLSHRGVITIEPVALTRGTTLDALAQQVNQAAEQLCRETGAERIDVVAHGVAGLAAAWWIRHLGGDAHVRRFVTLGTPWSGTRMAVFHRGPLASSLLPGASVLDDLSPAPTTTIAIWSTDDPWVVPSDHALPLGAESVQLDGAGHVDLLFSARGYRAVLEALTRPDTSTTANDP